MTIRHELREAVCGWVSTFRRGDIVLQVEANSHDPVDQAGAVDALERLWRANTTSTAISAPTPTSVLAASTAPLVRPVNTVSIADSIEHSLAINRPGRTAKSDLEFGRILRAFDGWAREHHLDTLAQVRNADVADYKRQLIERRALAPKTVNKHLSAIGTLFRDAQRAGTFPPTTLLPTTGQAFKKKAVAKASRSWLPLTRDDLIKAFDPGAFGRWRKPHEFWVPLVMLHHGLRVGEASQLSTDDIYREQGIWLLRIIDTVVGATMKTDASRRVVPLHPRLIELGLLAYLRDLRSAIGHDGLLFPYLRPNSLNGYGDVPGEAFNRYLDRCLANDRKRSHSLRHTANEQLKQGGVAEEVRCEFIGHDHSTINSTIYAGRLGAAAMAKIVFPVLEFPLDYRRLAYRRRRFDRVIRSELARRRRGAKRKTTAK